MQQLRQDLSALQSDLQSGNLTQSRSDFATLLNDAPRLKNALTTTSATTAAGSSEATSTVGSSLTTLSTALQSGDASGASAALTTLQQSLSSARVHHHHHHHHGGGGGAGDVASTAVQTDVRSLVTALQSGDAAGAQAAIAQLQQDDPALALDGSSAGGSSAASA